MNRNGSISSAEQNFRQRLEDFFISFYDEKSLPSHGIFHHRRVWNYAKDILNLPYYKECSQISAEKLIIACYLHDIGMIKEKGQRHGLHSRLLCLEFLRKNNLNPEEFSEMLDAVEHHDRKEYPDDIPQNILLNILSVADDLDAYGFIGIYRYLEIYHNRGINREMIGINIRENALSRFRNLMKLPGITPDFLTAHQSRFSILDNFFDKYNEQCLDYQSGYEPVGYCGTVEIIINLVDQKKDPIYCIEIYSAHPDPVVKLYFEGLKGEIDHN